jgi:glucuronosyltransferase
MRCTGVFMLSVLVVSASVGDSEAAKILGLLKYNSRSHFVMFKVLFKGLTARGHQVYVVGHFPQKILLANYTDNSVEGSLPELVNNVTLKFARNLGYIELIKFLWNTNLEMCRIVLEHPNIQELIHNNVKFYLIITEIMGPDCFIGLSHRFKAPFISIVTSVMLPWGNDRIVNPDHPGYIPNYFVPYTDHMTFTERITNTVLTEMSKLGYYYFAELPMDELSKQHFGHDVLPLAELKKKKKTSLIVANSHFSLNTPRPTVPGYIEVAALHIQRDGRLPNVS